VKRSGAREFLTYPTEEEALRAKEALLAESDRREKTISDALTDYEDYMRDDKGNKANRIDQTKRKLTRFFDDLSVELTSLTPAKCEALYVALRTSKRKPQKRTASLMGRRRRRQRVTQRSRSTTTATRCRRPRRSSAGA